MAQRVHDDHLASDQPLHVPVHRGHDRGNFFFSCIVARALNRSSQDVMQASLPGFVDAVKVDDFTIGKNALHLVSMRALPDQPHQKDYPKEEWIDQGSTEHPLDPKRMSEEDKAKRVEAGVEDLDQSGDYVNFEVRRFHDLAGLRILTRISYA